MWYKIIFLTCIFYESISSYDVGGVLSGNKMAGVPLGLSLGNGEPDVEGVCKQSGVTCQNCTHAVTCVMLPVGWLKVPLEVCADGMSCNGKLGGCVNKSVPECDQVGQKYQHTCEQVGVFPDAYDCRKFHLCSPPESLPDGKPADHRTAVCPRHYGFNPQTAQCSIKLEHGQCKEKPVPDCTQIGQTGVLTGSPNHYYVCLSRFGFIHPQIFICPHGWYFWGGFCRPDNPIVERRTEATTTSENTLPEEQSSTTKTTTSKTNAFLFSTDKPATYVPDTFMADKFPNLATYVDSNDAEPTSNDYFYSSENSW